MNGGLHGTHVQISVDRMYVHRSSGGRGLLGVEDTVRSEHYALYHYFKKREDVLMKKVLLSGIVNTPDDITIAPDAFKNHLNVMHFQNWRSKPLHGQYVNSLYDINRAHSFGWLTRCDLKIETESLFFAAQDQALNTNYYSNRILGGPNATC